MSYDRKDHSARIEAKARERQQQVLPAYRVVQAAGVVMAQVTTSEPWNRYLTYLQGQIEKTRGAKEGALAKLAAPDIWEAKDLSKLKGDIIRADAMIEALQWAMALPKALIDGGMEATEFLNKLEKPNESTGQPES